MELAAQANVHLNTVNLVEAGKKDVQLETIQKLAKGLDCEISDIFFTMEDSQ